MIYEIMHKHLKSLQKATDKALKEVTSKAIAENKKYLAFKHKTEFDSYKDDEMVYIGKTTINYTAFDSEETVSNYQEWDYTVIDLEKLKKLLKKERFNE